MKFWISLLKLAENWQPREILRVRIFVVVGLKVTVAAWAARFA
jgi:hypothetical protein